MQMRMEDTPYDAAMTRSKQELARQLVDANVTIEKWEKEAEYATCLIDTLKTRIEQLEAENADLRRWKALDKPITAAMSIANSHLAPLHARIEQLEAALRDIVSDIERFERVGHLYEKSAEIVAIARAALAPEQDK
jgi:chromosome segregation ATPase